MQRCAWRVRHALSTEADPLSSLDAQRPVAEAHRKPLREQLWRRAAAAERHYRAARIHRLREDAGPCHQQPETRGADRAQLDPAARALFRQHGRRGQGDQRHVRSAHARLRVGATLAHSVFRDGLRARRWFRLGAAHVGTEGRPAYQPICQRARARDRGGADLRGCVVPIVRPTG